jgi:hypothetical protein
MLLVDPKSRFGLGLRIRQVRRHRPAFTTGSVPEFQKLGERAVPVSIRTRWIRQLGEAGENRPVTQ